MQLINGHPTATCPKIAVCTSESFFYLPLFYCLPQYISTSENCRNMSEYIYTTSEVAKILEVSDRHVRRLCDRIDLKKEGKSYQITEKNLLEFQNMVDNNEVKQMPYLHVSELEEVQKENEVLKAENRILKQKLSLIKKEYEPYKDAEEKGSVIELFSKQEYELFEKILKETPVKNKSIESLTNEVKILTNQLEYMRSSMNNKEQQLNKLLDNIIQRNYIEAKDKKIE